MLLSPTDCYLKAFSYLKVILLQMLTRTLAVDYMLQDSAEKIDNESKKHESTQYKT